MRSTLLTWQRSSIYGGNGEDGDFDAESSPDSDQLGHGGGDSDQEDDSDGLGDSDDRNSLSDGSDDPFIENELQMPAPPATVRGGIKPLVVRFAEAVARASLKLGQTDVMLDFYHSLTADDLGRGRFPRQGRTLTRQLERYGGHVLHSRAHAAALPMEPERVLGFEERVYRVDHSDLVLIVMVRDLWSAILSNFLHVDSVSSRLHFGGQCVRNDDGHRVYSEMYTGNWWLQTEAALPLSARLLAVVLHIDDTPVSGQSVTPIYVTVGNLPMRERRTLSMMAPVAFMAKTAATKGVKATESFRHAKRRLFHKALHELLVSLEAVQRRGGEVIKFAHDGVTRRLVPALALVVADNEEKSTLSLTYKKQNCSAPCHECMVPRRRLHASLESCMRPHLPRLPANMRAIVAAADTARDRTSTADARRRAKAASLWPLHNAFWSAHVNIYMALPPDVLHDADLGVYRRLVLAVFAHLESISAAAADELDRLIHAVSTACMYLPGVKRFGPGGYRGLVRAEGAHYRTLMHMLPLAIRGVPAAAPEAVALLAEWPTLYATMRASAITAPNLDRWQIALAEWGERMHNWSAPVLASQRRGGTRRGTTSGADGDGGQPACSGGGGRSESDDSDGSSDGASDSDQHSDSSDAEDGNSGTILVVDSTRTKKRARVEKSRHLGTPKLHALTVHSRDAIQRFGVLGNYNAAPFEARHISAVKQAARRTSGSVALVPQLARLALRDELLRAVKQQDRAGAHAKTRNAMDDDSEDDHDAASPGLSWPTSTTTTLGDLERRLRVRDLETAAIDFLLAVASDRMPTRQAAVAAARAPLTELRRLHTTERGVYAYANHRTRRSRSDGDRNDDVAVRGTEGQTWYARLVALVRFPVTDGSTVDAALVRWYELTAPLRAEPATSGPTASRTGSHANAAHTTSAAQRTAVAINAVCKRLVLRFKMDFCEPDSVLGRAYIVPDLAATPHRGPAAAMSVNVGSTVFVNGFASLIHDPPTSPPETADD